MFFLPEVVGAMALMAARPDGRVPGSKLVLRVVRTVTDHVIEEHGYRGADLGLATVDQLWVDRLLGLFMGVAQRPERLVPALVAPVATRVGRIFVALVLLVLSIGASVAAASGSLNAVVRGFCGAVAALLLGVLAAALTLFGSD
jgi:hypothetical protein